jgi:hypothetical protein
LHFDAIFALAIAGLKSERSVPCRGAASPTPLFGFYSVFE